MIYETPRRAELVEQRIQEFERAELPTIKELN